MQEKEHRAIVDARGSRPEAAEETLLSAFTFHNFLFLLPLLPKGGIGQAVVEPVVPELVVRESVPQLDVLGEVSARIADERPQ